MTSTELDRLDPPPRPRRPPRRKIGPEERGVRASLKLIARADPALAAQVIETAQEIDRGELLGRDRIAARGQIRQCIVQLREWNPGGETKDSTARAQAQVESTRALYAVPEA